MRNRNNCKTRGCREPVHARGLCQKCYDHLRKRRKESAGADTVPTNCQEPGCKRAHHARGFCQLHYDLKHRQRGQAKPADVRAPDKSTAEADTVCRAPGCELQHHAKGLCKIHYSRMRRRGTLSEPTRTPVKPLDAARAHRGPERKDSARASGAGAKDRPTTKKTSRLELLKRRHARMKREIAHIAESFDKEAKSDAE